MLLNDSGAVSLNKKCESCNESYFNDISFRIPVEIVKKKNKSNEETFLFVKRTPSRFQKWLSYPNSPYQVKVRKENIISQGNHTGTHTAALAHAIDFGVGVNSNVVAAADGIVVDCVACFKTGGTSEQLRWKANYVVIKHEILDNNDGSVKQWVYSRYYHLNKTFVVRNQYVRKGELIALSGNTGYTFGPHLHFDVVNIIPHDLLQVHVKTIFGTSSQRSSSSVKQQQTASFKKTFVPVVPMTFSKVPFESFENLKLFRAEPFDLSATCQYPGNDQEEEEEMPFALVCKRGGSSSFREKCENASHLTNMKVLIIVDDDKEMRKGALPILVGDHQQQGKTSGKEKKHSKFPFMCLFASFDLHVLVKHLAKEKTTPPLEAYISIQVNNQNQFVNNDYSFVPKSIPVQFDEE